MPHLDFYNAITAALTVTVVAIAWYGLFHVRRGTAQLPPGPKGWPILGNVLDIPSKFQWLKYTEWTKQYGASPLAFIVDTC